MQKWKGSFVGMCWRVKCLVQLWGNEITAASFWSCITEHKYLQRLNRVYTQGLGLLFVLFFKPHMTSFEHSEWHKLSLSILLNILSYYPHSSLTYIHSCLRGVFSKLKVHPLSSKCGSPGKSPALTVSLIPGRMKQSTSRSPLSRDTEGNLLLFHSAAEETYSSGREPWGSWFKDWFCKLFLTIWHS